ncbi:related to cop9 signalosome complex subunit 7a [Ustilago trichophora]|uniref:Related to cop9 signalosome complex subunit 7a n=1 Tax=Ustilago trichophora TaxID=86804 RepID=A0A5C3ED99_9BASI|nr:related to cop9 signalosome complex subunit 7a [Ustilago trichophora]
MSAVAPSSFVTLSAGPSSSTSRLAPLLLVARSTKPRGAAAANLVHQAISSPGVFFFGELFDVPGVAELSASTDSPQLSTAYQLLSLFAYGTYSDYVRLSQQGSVPQLSNDQVQKLRQLTLLSLACQNKSLPYSILNEALGITGSSIRELEDLIIETIYAGLIQGKLNELQSRFEVHHVQGRDVPHPSMLSQPALSALPSLASSSKSATQLDFISASLQNWQSTTVSVLDSLQTRMDGVRSTAADSELQRQDHRQALLQNLIEAQHQLEAQQQQQQQRKGKGPANAMEIDESDTTRGGARKKASAVAGVRGSKRSRA